MKALCWNGIDDLRVERVPDPAILDPGDAIVRVRLSSVCGSDLPLISGRMPTMKPGDILGREFLGEVVETGPAVRHRGRGDRVIVAAAIGCGKCRFCQTGRSALCDNSNPQPEWTESAYGHGTGGAFGSGHAFGGYAGSHAEYVRVPFVDHNGIRVPDGIPDETAVFVSGAVPTGFAAADMARIEPGDVVAVWGCGGVGQMAMRCARLLGAAGVIGIDRRPDRLEAAQMKAGAEPLDDTRVDLFDALQAMTGGRGPDVCIDAVGMTAEGTEGAVLRAMVACCRKGGTLSVIGDHAGHMDRFPMGAAVNKGLTIRMGPPDGRHTAERLFGLIGSGDLDPSYLMTHKWPLDDAARGYHMFRTRTDNCMRVVFAP
ncbi:alcohol dehydrogenase catalytic domain-containing protein [Azospirillum halopraeferens]|uniref:alcohol dehydrogenase catalytic domain-containing protein n=1 Tax=Azospirillum halopraeferens TaxID=34010 RepID=UPI0003FF126A|nr:alcohol dehydrogenase catalytic domain-containing protein [Azospirillum halopraeferens]